MTETLPTSNIKFLIEGLEIRKQIYTDSINFWLKQQHKNPVHLKQLVQQLIKEEKLKIDLINSILDDIRNELYQS
ncbi:hypothetical protein AEA09_07050 [Lysinibacillus contaminans]|uniref:Uncharacterized protein n=1 Tax=Lysinibacillus contaminans TaxID=1293441 RepID=A0ABR5K0E9_9BACI|nr:hypothetical protein [Lysinibacillus contaminans]KOS68336.1 hypothetical protein AEA09_07050 [Lysinibacillus contaminans]